MAYLPPRIEIYQELQALGAPLETPLMPFCIVGPAYKVRDTAVEMEQYGSNYDGSKLKVVFSQVAGDVQLLKRAGSQVNLLVYQKNPSTGLRLPHIEAIQDNWDAPYGTAVLTGGLAPTVNAAVALTSTITLNPDPVWANGTYFRCTGGANDGRIFYVTDNTGAPNYIVAGYAGAVVADQAAPAGTANERVLTASGLSFTYDTATGVAQTYNGVPTFYVEIGTEVIEISASYGTVVDVQSAANPSTFVFDVDPGWAPGTTVVIAGTPANDGTYTVAGNLGASYTMVEITVVNQLAPAGTGVATNGTMTILPISSDRPTGGRGSKNTIPAMHFVADPVTVFGNNIYYNSATKTIGNLTSTQMATITEGNVIFRIPFESYPNFDSDPEHKAYIVNKYAPNSGLDIHRNVISLDIDIGFDVANRDPGDSNDFFNIFNSIVTVIGRVPSMSPYEDAYIPSGATGDYYADMADDSILLPSSMKDKYDNDITDAVVHSSYTTFQKALNKSATIANLPILLTQLSDIEKYYGDIRPENPLAYGCFLAMASGMAGYAVAVDTDGLVGFNRAIEMLEEMPVYSIVPMTDDDSVITSLKAHIGTMSQGQTSKWRVGIVSGQNVDSIVQKVGYCVGSIYPDDSGQLTRFSFYPEVVSAIVENDVLRVSDADTPEANGDYAIVDIAAGTIVGSVANVGIIGNFYPVAEYFSIASINALLTTITFVTDPAFAVNDLFYVSSTTASDNCGWYRVDSILAAPTYTVTKLTGLVMIDQPAPGGRGTKSQSLAASIFSKNSSYSIARRASNFAKSVGDRRVWNIFPDKVVVESPDVLPGYFAAAAFAGMVGSEPGPLPYNERTIPTIARVYGSNDIMGYEELNLVAEGGNTILYHAGVGALPTIREQLTTDMSSILTQQISLTVNMDFISYTLKNVLEPMKGKYNIDNDLLNTLKLLTTNTLQYFTTKLGGKRLVSFTDPVLTAQPENGCVIINSELKMASVGRVFQVVLNLTV